MLSPLAVANAKTKASTYKLSDAQGLHLLVETSGSKLRRLRYQFNRKETMLHSGPSPRCLSPRPAPNATRHANSWRKA